MWNNVITNATTAIRPLTDWITSGDMKKVHSTMIGSGIKHTYPKFIGLTPEKKPQKPCGSSRYHKD